MFEWNKLGRIFNPLDIKDKYWINEFAQAPSVLIFDEFIRVYFSCRPKPDANGQYISYSAFVDLNRNNLFEVVNISEDPVLKLGGVGTFDEFGTYPISVIEYREKVYAYYAGHTRCESVPFNTAIGIAVSDNNGETFDKLGAGPVLSYSPDEPFVLSGPKIRRFNDTWYMWYISGLKWIKTESKPEVIYKIRMAYSSDGLNWTKINRNIIEDEIGEDETQASPDVFFSSGKYHMFFCFKHATDFRLNRERSYRIGYAWSNDMINWNRDDSKAGIDVSDDGWDSEMVAYPHVFELDNKIYMLYLGNQVGRYGFGIAQLEGRLV
ncbi:glycosylase [Paenibacillus sp. FSL R5-0470]|uniref:glycosylase n=1 Tax=Paenibacillus sp. FSL R5-0470 TaxID=2921641 RepID=UPI0030D8C022